MTSTSLSVPDKLFDSIVDSIAGYCRDIRNCEPEDALRQLIEGAEGALSYVHYLLPFVSSRSGQPAILEIGSGLGFGLCSLIKHGYDALGVEPGRTTGFEGRYAFATQLLRANGISAPGDYLMNAVAEALPFEDGRFDIVFALAVFEHVADVEKGIREALRVVKRGGVVLINLPNNHSFYEGHYDIFWLPVLQKSKWLARRWVQYVYHREPYFIDELNFITPMRTRRLVRGIAPDSSVWILPGFDWPRLHKLDLRLRALVSNRQDGWSSPKEKVLEWICLSLMNLGLASTFDLIIKKKR